MQCGHAFVEEALEVTVLDVPGHETECEVTHYRPFGDLRVRIDAVAGTVIDSQMWPPHQPRGPGFWQKPDRRVCSLSSAAGLAPWMAPISPKLVRFAFDGLVRARERDQLIQ